MILYDGMFVNFHNKWRVKLFHEIDTSDWSEIWNFTTRPRRAPTLLSPADSALNISIITKLSWQAYSGASSYAVQYGMKSDLSDAINTTSNLTNKNVTLKPNTRYYWRVRGRNSDGNEFYDYSEVWTFVTDSGIPKPNLLSPPNNANNQLPIALFSWTKFDQATSYRIEISEDQTFNSAVVAKNISTSSTTFNHLQQGKTYYWRVKIISGSIESPWSEVWQLSMKAQNSVDGFSKDIIQVYPNPSPNKFTLLFNSDMVKVLYLRDVTGKLIFNKKNSVSSSEVIDLSSFPPGTYLLQIETKKGFEEVTLIKE